MNAQHTPGPWKLSDAGDSITAPSGARIAELLIVHDAPDRIRQFDANARLISAAPDLLAALQLVYSNAGESPEWIRARIGQAIAKAEGRA